MIFPFRILAAVGFGSAIGALARYGLALALLNTNATGFPWATLLANGFGSMVIGYIAAVNERLTLSEPVRHFLVTGLCGGFTTFSIFSLEMLVLTQSGAFTLAGIYLGASLGFWMTAVWAGWLLGQPRKPTNS